MFDWAKRFWDWLRNIEISDDVEAIRNLTVKFCGFLPTVATVTGILGLGNPALATVTAVATAICAAVTGRTAVASLKSTPPTVEGVVIEGEWVK